jgi:lysophospholipase L1-like esterase
MAMSSVTKRLAFWSVLTLGPVVALELGLRLLDAARGVDSRARVSWYWGFRQDRLLGFRARPNLALRFKGGNLLDTNADGFRDIEVPVQPPAARTLIACLGESSTWGTGCSSRLTTWPRHFEQELQRRTGDSTIRTLNAGMPGFTTVENTQLLEHCVLKYRPAIVLYMGFRNDYTVYGTSLDPRVDLHLYPRTLAPLPSTLPYELLMRSALVSFIASRTAMRLPLDDQGARPAIGTGELLPRAESTFRDQIAVMKTLCARHGIKLLWIDQAIDYGRVTTVARNNLERLRSVLHDELDQQGIPLIACHSMYDRGKAPMLDDVHFDDAGNAQLAQIIAPQVEKYLNTPAVSHRN